MPILVGEVRLTKPPAALLTTPCGKTKARLVPGGNPLAKSVLLLALPTCRHKAGYSTAMCVSVRPTPSIDWILSIISLLRSF
jgi:hypothetical protein